MNKEFRVLLNQICIQDKGAPKIYVYIMKKNSSLSFKFGKEKSRLINEVSGYSFTRSVWSNTNHAKTSDQF